MIRLAPDRRRTGRAGWPAALRWRAYVEACRRRDALGAKYGPADLDAPGLARVGTVVAGVLADLARERVVVRGEEAA